MFIQVDELVKILDYSPSYFKKILTKAQTKSRIVLDNEDIKKIIETMPIKNSKSYNLYIKLNSMLQK